MLASIARCTILYAKLSNKAIGAALSISDRTVQGHLANIYDKVGAASRTEAVMRAVALGWIPPAPGDPDQA